MCHFIFPKFILNIERWKWNSEYRIYVSNLGNFKNEHKQRLPIKIANNGYCSVKTEVGFKLAHRIVMLTWKPIPNAEELTVDHLNHNKRDNSLNNLEWVSEEENKKRAKDDYIFNKHLDEKRNKKILKGGQKEFSSFVEAAEWIKQKQGMPANASIEKIISRIENAIVNNTMYCGRKWRVV